ncbi:MAG TPA: hypothetical protein VNZ49_04835 [Bacteroidia bacterium]|nr:hypothetical protein [Bacteroidia bacterium]
MNNLYILLFFLLWSSESYSQDTTSVDDDVAPKSRKEKGFHAGFFVGTYFANKYTSSLYDGYGIDANGNKNDFYNSAMYRQIVLQNGGYYSGQPDRIAQVLNVQHNEWSFGQGDMPINLKYNIAFMVGVNLRYAFNKTSSLILNANTSKLTVNGDFTIETQTLVNGNQQPVQIKTFALVGGEQRLLMQLGYQQILGDNDKMNFFIEGGANVTMAKLTKNQINVNGLIMDLTNVYYYQNYTAYRNKYLTGVGIGAFAGMGLNITLGNKWLMQMLYSPSYEFVKLGTAPKFTLNHAFGVRGYYLF